MQLEDLVPEDERHPFLPKKFVAASREENKNLRLFRFGDEHITKLKDDEQLIGAGDYTDGRAHWGSHSLKTKLGYDRPSDFEEAERVLVEIQAMIERWQQQI